MKKHSATSEALPEERKAGLEARAKIARAEAEAQKQQDVEYAMRSCRSTFRGLARRARALPE
eukprot:11058006-Lingulodinium_polyedra.AAC.1